MNATDFKYDGISLSSFNFVIANLSGKIKTNEVVTDSQRVFNQISLQQGRYNPFVSIVYKQALVMEWQICKNPCLYDGDDIYITTDEIRQLKRWLCKPHACTLEFEDDDFKDIHWEGTFNLEEVFFGDIRLGATLTFTANRPYAVGETYRQTGTVNASEPFNVENVSDEYEYLYPNLTIKCLEAGDLIISTNWEQRKFIVNNVSVGETLNFTPLLTCSSNYKHLAKDFNYHFVRLWRNYDTTTNELTSSLNIEYDLFYEPCVKAVFI